MRRKLLGFILSMAACVITALALVGCVFGVTSVTLNKTELTLKEGESETLVATVLPDNATNKEVIWTSNDESVVTVVEGEVTAVAVGTATVTATVGGISATCEVTVIPATVDVTSVTLNKTELTLAVEGEETLVATVLPDNATNKEVIWASSNEEIATVVNGKVTALKAGEVTITATVEGKSATCTVRVKFIPKWDGSVAGDSEMAGIYDDATKTYTVSTGSQLAWIATQVNEKNVTFEGVTFVLANDIDLMDEAWTAIGNVDAYPGKTFNGVLDGANYTLYNLNTTDRSSNWSTAGLFGSVYNATIKNLTIDGAKIDSDHYVGVLVGYTSNGVTIENCTVRNATVLSEPVLLGTEYDNGDKVGGLGGYLNGNVTITGCTVEDVVITGYRHIGGLVGYLSGTVTVEGNTVKNAVITQDDKNGYKDEASVATLVGEFVGNGATIGDNTSVNVKVVNKDVT